MIEGRISDSLGITKRIALRVGKTPIPPEPDTMPEADKAAENAAIYDDLKTRVFALGMKLADFAGYLGLSMTTMPKWRSIGTPPYAINVLKLLETYTVPAAWKASRQQPAATQEDAMRLLRPALTAVVDDAIAKGWSRDQIGAVMRRLADETDPAGRG